MTAVEIAPVDIQKAMATDPLIARSLELQAAMRVIEEQAARIAELEGAVAPSDGPGRGGDEITELDAAD